MNRLTTIPALVVVVSELVALVVIYRLWRSDDALLFKIVLSVLALIPVFGPVLVLWIGNWPDRQHPALQDREKNRADVHERWREVFAARSPVRRFRQWQAVMDPGQRLVADDATPKPPVRRDPAAKPLAVWWLVGAVILGALLGFVAFGD
jgi:hypothetical protein